MWANAQRDGRPAEYGWHPLFNAAKFGWHPLLECRAVTLSRRETRWNLQGCPELVNRSQPLVGRSSPYCEDMWKRYCSLTNFFPIVDTCHRLRRYSPTKLCDGAQMAIFSDIFASCVFSEPRAAGFRHASEIRTKATPCVEVWQTSNLWRLRLGEEKKKKKKPQGKKYNGLPYYMGRP